MPHHIRRLHGYRSDTDWLQNELLSASNMSEGATKILSEKLALSRELAVLKPEIDHLRSQLAHQKDVLAEKLALERQLNTLEVELANEKRATQKVLQRQQTQDNEAEEQLRQRVADLEKKLCNEQKAAQKAKAAQEKAQSSAEEELQQQITDLEAKLSAEQKASEKARKMYEKVQTDAEGELRQQVANLEKQLVSEQRAAQKAKRSQNSNDTENEAKLQEKLQELEADKREAERSRKTAEKETATARDQVEMLTQRVEEFKGKLRETRAELKEVRAELTQARTKTTSVPLKNDDEPKKPLSKAKGGKKRRANEISIDEMMLDTPGHAEGRAKRPIKKKGIDYTAVGEKSTFSITPFLEKSNTINLAETIEEEAEEPSILESRGDPAAPIIEPEAETAEEVPLAEKSRQKSVSKALKATKMRTGATEKKARGKAKAQALAESSPNVKITAASKSESTNNTTTLEKVIEESQDVRQETAVKDAPVVKLAANVPIAADVSNTSSENPEPKKKKRKLLGASNKGTLFDKDEDAGESEAPVPTAAAVATKRNPVGLKATATRKGPVSSLAKSAFGGKTFSPLKKDRRGVGASFLA